MKILVVASEIPYPPTDSNRGCYYHLLRDLRPEHDATVLAMSSGGSGRAAVEKAYTWDAYGRPWKKILDDVVRGE